MDFRVGVMLFDGFGNLLYLTGGLFELLRGIRVAATLYLCDFMGSNRLLDWLGCVRGLYSRASGPSVLAKGCFHLLGHTRGQGLYWDSP